MALHPEVFEIDDPEDPSEVVESMDTLAYQQRGWINIRPVIPPDAIAPARSMLSQFFRRNSPEVALGTWMPETTKAGPRQLVGIQHALGEKLSPRLHHLGLTPPEGWRRMQDSPRRGLLVVVPPDEDHLTVLRWLLELTVAITRVETTGAYEISVYPGRAS